MSLDITLAKVTYVSDKPLSCPRCGHDDWPHEKKYTTVFEVNITHNLTQMAAAVDLYDTLWHPEKIRANTAKDLIEPLKRGIEEMYHRREELKEFNPYNGWGSHETFCEALEKLLKACVENPDAVIEVSR